jgi:hypothetical protein
MMAIAGENHARVVHRSPGRLRVRVAALRDEPELGRRIAAHLGALPGVSDIRVTESTGSVLVLHEAEQFDEERLARAAREAELFELTPEPTETTAAAPAPRGSAIWGAWGTANRTVNRFSRDLLDLRTLIPLALVLWSIRQILTERPLVRTPWYTLLWYAFGIFTRFSPPPK